ncbi:hypothetical protein ACF3M1_12260 [Luteimonas sp. WGS1318]|uniref:hypothetical protein n=1 Tax=Luteimonas sp. WGS1318 TaxID=3366815 RepID=UPI00372D39FA
MPVAALLAMPAAMPLAARQCMWGHYWQCVTQWFPSLNMCVLALLTLHDERFSSMLLDYDLLAPRWLHYACMHPSAEARAVALMVAAELTWP